MNYYLIIVSPIWNQAIRLFIIWLQARFLEAAVAYKKKIGFNGMFDFQIFHQAEKFTIDIMSYLGHLMVVCLVK